MRDPIGRRAERGRGRRNNMEPPTVLSPLSWDPSEDVEELCGDIIGECSKRSCSSSRRSRSGATETADPCGDPGGSALRRVGGDWVGGVSRVVSSTGRRFSLCSLGGSLAAGAGGRRGRKIGAIRNGGTAARSTSGDQSERGASVLVATDARVTVCTGGLPARTTPGVLSAPTGSVAVATDTRAAGRGGEERTGCGTSVLTGRSSKALTIRVSACRRVSPISLRPRCFLVHVEASWKAGLQSSPINLVNLSISWFIGGYIPPKSVLTLIACLLGTGMIAGTPLWDVEECGDAFVDNVQAYNVFEDGEDCGDAFGDTVQVPLGGAVVLLLVCALPMAACPRVGARLSFKVGTLVSPRHLSICSLGLLVEPLRIMIIAVVVMVIIPGEPL
ncbi:uncharacterized protein [Nerophis lumbriciformis]|uniref:uncharacterized protein n=3 Tax=Nerophis lumbriciformis TaxID=546530 RepID=UPI003BA9C031